MPSGPYVTLIAGIKTILESVSSVKSIYSYPIPGNPEVYPAVIFFPESFDNSYLDTKSNFKEYKFKLFVVVDIPGKDEEKVFGTVLPKVVDDVVAAFDAQWSGTFASSRTWKILDFGSISMTVEQNGKRANAELNLTVRMATGN